MLNHRMNGREHDLTVHPVLIHRERWNSVDLIANGNRGDILADRIHRAHRFITKPRGEFNRLDVLIFAPHRLGTIQSNGFHRMRTWPAPAFGTSTFLNLNTSGPPASENSTTRDILNPRFTVGDDDSQALASFAKARAGARPIPVSAPVIKTTGVFICGYSFACGFGTLQRRTSVLLLLSKAAARSAEVRADRVQQLLYFFFALDSNVSVNVSNSPSPLF
jgi:hypothetical protein